MIIYDLMEIFKKYPSDTMIKIEDFDGSRQRPLKFIEYLCIDAESVTMESHVLLRST